MKYEFQFRSAFMYFGIIPTPTHYPPYPISSSWSFLFSSIVLCSNIHFIFIYFLSVDSTDDIMHAIFIFVSLSDFAWHDACQLRPFSWEKWFYSSFWMTETLWSHWLVELFVYCILHFGILHLSWILVFCWIHSWQRLLPFCRLSLHPNISFFCCVF